MIRPLEAPAVVLILEQTPLYRLAKASSAGG